MRNVLLAALFMILLIAPVAEVQEPEHKLFLTNIARKYDMAFPTTGILETFTGANGTTPPNANWTNDVIGAGAGNGIEIQSNEGAAVGGGVDSAYWNAGTDGPNCEIYMEVPTRPADTFDVSLFARVQNPGIAATVAGYVLSFTRDDGAGDDLRLRRADAGSVFTTIGAPITVVFSDGDWFGLRIDGSTFEIWHNPIGTGVWVQVGTRTDATYSVAGNLAIVSTNATARVDNFGGGTIAASSTTTTTGLWDIALPEEATNMALNPSFEIVGNFAAVGGGAMTQVAEYGWVGLYGARIQTAGDDEGGSVTLSALTNAIHYVTIRVRGALPTAWDWSLDDAAYYAPDLLLDYDGTWYLYGLEFSAAEANGSTRLYIRQSGAGAGDFYIDGVNVTLGNYPTSHVDGTQLGCEWNGAAHASTSMRSGWSRAGGRWLNLDADFGFHITEMIDSGVPPITNISDTYALAAGGQVQGVKVHERSFSLMGKFIGTSLTNLNALRQALLNAVKPGAVPETSDGPQPFLLRYTGAAVVKKISVHYESGLEARINGRFVCSELIPLRVFADDPYFYEIGNSAASLDTNDSATTRYLAGRLRSTGQWDDLGLSANPTTNGSIFAVLVSRDKDVYYFGDYTGLNGVAGRDYGARYDPSTQTWASLDGASALNGRVWDAAEAPNGLIYLVGAFTNAGGVANADYFAIYDPDADTFSTFGAIGTGATITALYGVAIDNEGDVVVVGDGTNFAGVAAADYIGKWDVSAGAWVAVGVPNAGAAAIVSIREVAISTTNTYYVVGEFDNLGNITLADNVAMYDGAWGAVGDLSSMISTILYTVDIDQANNIYVGGNITGPIGLNILKWDGGQWSGMGGGTNGTVWKIQVLSSGEIIAAGSYATISGINADRIAIYNGFSWIHYDIVLPGSAIMRGIRLSEVDPVINTRDTWVGFSTTGTSYFSGSATITNSGTERALPTFSIYRTGGTTAVVKQIRNEETGKTLSIDYDLQDGETLTINLETLAITSSYFGNVPGAILPGSDTGTFELLSGDNQITAFVDVTGAPTITAWAEYKDTYGSFD